MKYIIASAIVLGVILGGIGLIPSVEVYEAPPEVEEVPSIPEPVEEDWTQERIIALIRDTFPEDPERAIAIARCESGLRPDAVGPTQDGGVFQIHIPSHGKRLEELGFDIWDPVDNVKFARMLYDEQEWQPWVCHTKQLAYK